jgi:hypothetical protein
LNNENNMNELEDEENDVKIDNVGIDLKKK